MTTTQVAQKRSAADISNPLLYPGILQNVLSYVGSGHCLFVASVSTWWKGMYATVESHQLAVCGVDSCASITITCDPQMTLYSSVFASPSRVAYASELDCTSEAYLLAAGKHADAAALAAAHEMGMEYTAATLAGAAQYNRLAEVQYLHSHGCPWPTQLLEEVARRGYFELVRWCHKRGCPWVAMTAPYHAAQSGNVELMAWVLQQPGTQLSGAAMNAAAMRGHTAMCQFLHTQQCSWGISSTSAAAASGHVDPLRWLVNNGCPWDAHMLCMSAARSGSVEVLTYLQHQGLPTSIALLTDMLDYAAYSIELAAAQWLREQGAEWPVRFKYGPWRGEVLAWARAEGCTTPTTN
jgi:hypothetical protein